MAGTPIDITERKPAEERQQIPLRELQTARFEVKTLRGLIKICAHAKQVLTDQDCAQWAADSPATSGSPARPAGGGGRA